MHHFQYRNKELYCEEIPIREIAEREGTPLYLYSHATIMQHYRAFDDSFNDIRHITCFSMKSNSNLAILRLFAREGGGVDIVSGGELYRALKAGVDPGRIVYSGVGKRAEDLEFALRSRILMFNTESVQELHQINHIAEKMNVTAPVAIRVNPDIDPETHPYISTGLKENKFGIPIDSALEEYTLAAGLHHLKITGISCHIGSQLTQLNPFIDTLGSLMVCIKRLEEIGIHIDYLDLGGGLGITYDSENPPHPTEYAGAIKAALDMKDLTLILEPGRVIMGNAGILVTKVLYTKSMEEKRFFIVDAAMNDLIRPSLYGSFHAVQPLKISERGKVKADIVGPICESSDFLVKNREVDAFEPGEMMAIMSAGAYGFSMASNYNSRPRVAEVMARGDQYYVIRAAETYEDLIRGEVIPDFLN